MPTLQRSVGPHANCVGLASRLASAPASLLASELAASLLASELATSLLTSELAASLLASELAASLVALVSEFELASAGELAV